MATGTWALGRRTCCPPRRFTPRLRLPALATSPQLTSGQSVPVGHTLGDHGLAQQLPRQRSRQGQSRGTRSRARPAGGEARPPVLPASSVAHLLRHEWPLWRSDERRGGKGGVDRHVLSIICLQTDARDPNTIQRIKTRPTTSFSVAVEFAASAFRMWTRILDPKRRASNLGSHSATRESRPPDTERERSAPPRGRSAGKKRAFTQFTFQVTLML